MMKKYDLVASKQRDYKLQLVVWVNENQFRAAYMISAILSIIGVYFVDRHKKPAKQNIRVLFIYCLKPVFLNYH